MKALIDKIIGESDSKPTTLRCGTTVWNNKEGQLHRVDGPAIIDKDGRNTWYLNNLIHREGGPAHSNLHGYEEWYNQGKRHRTDGPAVVAGKRREYYVNGRRFTEEEFYRYVDQDTGDVLVPPGKKLHHDDDDNTFNVDPIDII